MGLKYERPSIFKWSWRAAAVVAAVVSVALIGVGPADAIPSPNTIANRADSTGTFDVPAHQMAELNFLLGNYTCTIAPGETDQETTRKIFDGNYYQQTVTLHIAGEGTLETVWTLGWNPVNLNFVAQYFDNLGNSGTGTSPGWQDGHLKIKGTYVIVYAPGGASGIGVGLHETGYDDFQIIGPGHYTDTSYGLSKGKWITEGVGNCRQSS
jgi:hypothetical protein